jgi:hypothetical protein
MKADMQRLLTLVRQKGWARHSTLWLMMRAHFDELSRAIEDGEATITGVGRALAEQGARDRRGREPSDRCIRQTWRRVAEAKRAAAAKAARAADRRQPLAGPVVAKPEAAPGVRLIQQESETQGSGAISVAAALEGFKEAVPWAGPRQARRRE